MKYYTIKNKADRCIRIFAETDQRAIDMAMDIRHAFKEENLTIVTVKEAPEEYHEGVASRRIPMETLNLETLQLEPTGDLSKMGWYGGREQQPKVGDPEWDCNYL